MSGTQDVLNLPYPEMGNFNQEELARAVSVNFQEVTRYVSYLQQIIKSISGGTVAGLPAAAATWNTAALNAAQAIEDAATAQGTADGKVTTYFDAPSWKYLINQLSADYVRYYLYGGEYTAQSFIPIGNIVGADNLKVSLLSGGKTWMPIDTHWHIYADNAGEPGTSISTTGYGIITGENWPESTDEWIDVEIETDTPLVAGTTYWIVVQGQGSGSYYVKYSTNSNVYAGGVWSRSGNAGATWSAQSNYDMTFKVGCLTLDVDDMSEGDLWFDTGDGNKLYRYNETGASWVEVQDADIAQAISDASTAQSTADGKIVTYYQDTEPTEEELTIGDLWVDTNDYNKLYRYDGTAWQSAKDGNFPDATVISNKTAGGISDAIDGFGTGSDGAFNSVDDVTFSIESDDTYSVIKQYSSFTLNTGHTLTVDKRCRGLFIFVRGDVEINGTIDMSGKGGKISREMSAQRMLQVPVGVTLIDIPPGGFGGNGGSGGAGGDAVYDPATPGSGGAGRTGSVATWFSGGFGAPGGGGGSGAAGYSSSQSTHSHGENGGAAGTTNLDVAVGSGGVAGGTAAAGGTGGNLSGGGGAGRALVPMTSYSGAGGGGAGINGGYAGTGANGATDGDSDGGLSGGLVCVIAKGDITINSGAYVKANGYDGGDGGTGGYAPEERNGGGGGGGGQGGGGGGVAVLAYGGSYTNNGTIQVNGGSAGSGGIGGAKGGETGTTDGVNGTNGTNGSVGTIVLVAL